MSSLWDSIRNFHAIRQAAQGLLSFSPMLSAYHFRNDSSQITNSTPSTTIPPRSHRPTPGGPAVAAATTLPILLSAAEVRTLLGLVQKAPSAGPAERAGRPAGQKWAYMAREIKLSGSTVASLIGASSEGQDRNGSTAGSKPWVL